MQPINSICSPTSFEGIEFTTAHLSCRRVLRDSNEYATFTLKAYQGGMCCSSFTFGMAMAVRCNRRLRGVTCPFRLETGKEGTPSIPQSPFLLAMSHNCCVSTQAHARVFLAMRAIERGTAVFCALFSGEMRSRNGRTSATRSSRLRTTENRKNRTNVLASLLL